MHFFMVTFTALIHLENRLTWSKTKKKGGGDDGQPGVLIYIMFWLINANSCNSPSKFFMQAYFLHAGGIRKGDKAE